MHKEKLNSLIDLWFSEDIGNGDHTSLSTIPEKAQGSASLHAKEAGIIAGIEISKQIFERFDPDMEVTIFKQDGDIIAIGDIILKITGKARSILQSERLFLNVMQRMSGIATTTAKYVSQVEGTKTRILDTRKTTPGFRYMEKEAVRIGGGVNHRFGLYDMVMIKDNHIDFAGGITMAIESCKKYLQEKKLDIKIEVEVRSMEDIEETLKCGGIHRILIDNFSPKDTVKAVALIDGKVETESSGGITFDTIKDYAECGVDYISVGALTHHISSLDLSLKADFQS